MIKLSDLWIGDQVLLLKSNRKGVFQGVKEGKARIQVGKKIILSSASNLQKLKEEKLSKLEIFFEEEQRKASLIKERVQFVEEIDLHIEVLQPSKKNDNPVAILEFQIRKLKEFIQKSIRLKMGKVRVIHGKGTGALKMEAYHVFKEYEEIVSLIPTNNDGAVLVYFKY